MFANAQWSLKGIFTGEPYAPVRHTWIEVHQRARHVAGGRAAAWGGYGDAVTVLAAPQSTSHRPHRASETHRVQIGHRIGWGPIDFDVDDLAERPVQSPDRLRQFTCR